MLNCKDSCDMYRQIPHKVIELEYKEIADGRIVPFEPM